MPLCHVFQAAIKPPTAMKSGTTICGIQLKDAVLLAADTRATEGPMVADKKLYLKFSTVLFPPTMVQRCRVSISFWEPTLPVRNCEKLHYISKNVFCAGAGTAADLQHLVLH